MKRIVILTILLVGAISISGCANGPLKRARRGAQCGGGTNSCQYGAANCGQQGATSCGQCGSATNSQCNTGNSYYGSSDYDYGATGCSECGATATPQPVEYYEGGVLPTPSYPPIPAPGPGQ